MRAEQLATPIVNKLFYISDLHGSGLPCIDCRHRSVKVYPQSKGGDVIGCDIPMSFSKAVKKGCSQKEISGSVVYVPTPNNDDIV